MGHASAQIELFKRAKGGRQDLVIFGNLSDPHGAVYKPVQVQIKALIDVCDFPLAAETNVIKLCILYLLCS